METRTRAQYEEDKANLLEKVKSGLDQLQANLNSMNRNLETANAIGSQFKEPSHLWDSFHKVIAPATDTLEKHSARLKDMSGSEGKLLAEEERL